MHACVSQLDQSEWQTKQSVLFVVLHTLRPPQPRKSVASASPTFWLPLACLSSPASCQHFPHYHRQGLAADEKWRLVPSSLRPSLNSQIPFSGFSTVINERMNEARERVVILRTSINCPALHNKYTGVRIPVLRWSIHELRS